MDKPLNLENLDNSQVDALRWVLSNEIVDDPNFLNQLNLAVLMQSRLIKYCEFLISKESSQILIYIELSWLGKFKYFETRIIKSIEEIIKTALPSYTFRITQEKSILNLAINKLKGRLEVKHETSNSSN